MIETPSGIGQANRFLTISNILSLSRAILAIPFAVVMLSDSPDSTLWGILILALAALTDKLDGVLARRLNQVTEWGKILDPISDKIGIAAVAIVLVALDLIPAWFVILIVLRDMLILIGGIYIKRRRTLVLESNVLGKWTIGVLALTMFSAMLRWDQLTEFILWTSVGMLIASLFLYARRFLAILKFDS